METLPPYSNGREKPLKRATVWVRIPPGVQRLSRAERELARGLEAMELVDRREYKRLSRAERELARVLEAMELVDRREYKRAPKDSEVLVR